MVHQDIVHAPDLASAALCVGARDRLGGDGDVLVPTHHVLTIKPYLSRCGIIHAVFGTAIVVGSTRHMLWEAASIGRGVRRRLTIQIQSERVPLVAEPTAANDRIVLS